MSHGYIEGRQQIAPGRSAYWQAWLPPDRTAAVIVIVHGLHEHSARYAHVGARLAEAGFATYAADYRGHGRSDGRRGNIERMALVVADLDAFVRLAADRHSGLPVFMVGHSIGGLIALWYATEPDTGLDGLVVSGPAIHPTVGSALQKRLAGLLSVLFPDLGVATLDATEKISRDPAVVRAYRTDPLVYHGKIKARTGSEILLTMQGLPARLPRITVPLLLLHGTDDRICFPTDSTMVHGRVSSPDKTLCHYQGLYHEVFNEPERDRVLSDLVRWLNLHIPHRDPATRSAG